MWAILFEPEAFFSCFQPKKISPQMSGYRSLRLWEIVGNVGNLGHVRRAARGLEATVVLLQWRVIAVGHSLAGRTAAAAASDAQISKQA